MDKQRQVAHPRPAAAGIILSEGDDFEVLMARRNKALRFMGGHHVFPGGAIEDSDGQVHVEGAPDADTAKAIAAVVREVFEETGLLCARGELPAAASRRTLRFALLRGELTLARILQETGLRIHAADFTPAGIWITPRWSPVRFYTRYFIFRHAGPRYAEVVEPEGEIVALDWLRPLEARARWHAGDLKLSTPVAFVLRFLAGMPLDEVVPWLDKTPHRYDEPNLFEMRRGIHIAPLRTRTLPPAHHTNCVIVGERDLCVIDPGAHAEEEQRYLMGHLQDMGVLGGRPALVLLTHGHRDHVGGARALHEAFGIPVWAHGGLADRVDVPLARTLEDGDLFDIDGGGWRIRVLHTPGHDPAHLCFLEETTGTLVVGDMIANPGTVVISPELGGDMTVYLEQLERLAETDFQFLIPGHGLPFPGREGREKLHALIAHRHEREARVKAALAAGHRSMTALLHEVYDDTPTSLWPLATQQLQAHLLRLGVAPESLD